MRTPAQARAWALHPHTGYGGQCLRFVRNAYGLPSRFGSAHSQWNDPGARHSTSSLTHVPANAPIFFSAPWSRYGHVALYLGGGKMRTATTASRYVQTQSVSLWTHAGWHLLGWRGDLENVNLHLGSPPSGGSSLVLKRGSTGSHVLSLQHGLNRVFPAYSHLNPDGQFGPATETVVKEFQRRAGLERDGVVGHLTKAALARVGITF